MTAYTPGSAILGDGLWKRHFGAQCDVLGRSVLLHKNDYTVVVCCRPISTWAPADVYVPIAHIGARVHDMPSVGACARLKRGVPVQTAQADIDHLCRGGSGSIAIP